MKNVNWLVRFKQLRRHHSKHSRLGYSMIRLVLLSWIMISLSTSILVMMMMDVILFNPWSLLRVFSHSYSLRSICGYLGERQSISLSWMKSSKKLKRSMLTQLEDSQHRIGNLVNYLEIRYSILIKFSLIVQHPSYCWISILN